MDVFKTDEYRTALRNSLAPVYWPAFDNSYRDFISSFHSGSLHKLEIEFASRFAANFGSTTPFSYDEMATPFSSDGAGQLSYPLSKEYLRWRLPNKFGRREVLPRVDESIYENDTYTQPPRGNLFNGSRLDNYRLIETTTTPPSSSS